MDKDKTYDRICKLCGHHFEAKCKNAWYCAECRVIVETRRLKHRCDVLRQKYRRRMTAKYTEGITYVCKECGRTIIVHERTCRSTCDECLSKTVYGRKLLRNRKYIQEEVVSNGTAET